MNRRKRPSAPEDAAQDDRRKPLPYRLRDVFLSSGEIACYRFLQEIVGGRFVICPKVALTEVVSVARPNENVHFFKKIFRKSVDFLLLSRQTMKPVMGVQLVRPGGKEGVRPRDRFLQDVFAAVGLPLACIPMAGHYDRDEILPLFHLALVKLQTAHRAEDGAADHTPVCPKCGVTMVLRIVREGPRAGEQYYGCMNYPRCTETVPVPA